MLHLVGELRGPHLGVALADDGAGLEDGVALLAHLGGRPQRVHADPLDVGEVWTYRDPRTGDVALLLFSDAVHKPAALPPAVALQSPAWLRAFLSAHEAEITTVFFDIAGPHPMQASPADLLAALDLDA